jgi:signal transduction histidine kinase
VRLPIRARLTAWYVALLAAILIALGIFVVVQLRADLTADTDSRLTEAAAEIAFAFESEGVKDFRDISGSVLHGDAVAQVVDAGGGVIATHGEELEEPGPIVDRATIEAAVGGSARRLTVPFDGPYRALARPVSRAGDRFALITAESLEPVDRSVERLLTLLLIGGPAALLLTGAGGWWLARKALRPVDRMTTQAAAMGPGDLDRRLELPRTDDEVAHLGRTLNAMLDRIERGVEDKRQLIADASHELRAPLTVMRAELDVALGDPALDPSARPVLASSRDEVDRMARMVDDMLTLASIDEGRLELFEEPVELRALADRVASRFYAGVVVEGDRATAIGDAMQLEHALRNLVDNALKYGGDGTVRVETWQAGSEIGVAVSDDGPGIPAGERGRVFERFVRLDAARGRGGSGLGLAICAEIARAHGGRAFVEPAAAGGSRFVLALPATSGGRQPPPAADRRQPTAP